MTTVKSYGFTIPALISFSVVSCSFFRASMEHQNENTAIRSKKTTIMPIRLLVTLTSFSPKLILPDEHLATMAYCQYFGAEFGSEHYSTGKMSPEY